MTYVFAYDPIDLRGSSRTGPEGLGTTHEYRQRADKR